ncbi:MAG: phosphoribosylformylglycinamidine cyclo-ligase [Calditrichota bacterium]|jgi:phosphoribosylformylglycinamidine cyclo-ligase
MNQKFSYKKAGVDIEKAEKALSKLKSSIAKTHNKHVLKNIGAFGGFYQFPIKKYKNPILISSTDGVGTKLKVAVMMNKHDTVGQDLVNHCINDIAVCGATPLFFLDYFGCGKLSASVYHDVIMGFVKACQKANLPLIGGETAEMPDVYHPGEYDLVGTIVGAVERNQIIDGSDIREGDQIIGIASNGLHTNGFSLARKVLFPRFQPDEILPGLHLPLGEELLKIHLNYFPIIKKLKKHFSIKGLAHITGGGLFKNTIRIVPEGLLPEFNWRSWEVPPIFQLIQKTGQVPIKDMRQTFNIGIGLVVVIRNRDLEPVTSIIQANKYKCFHIGKIISK